MTSIWPHVKPLLLARTSTLVGKLLSASFLVALPFISTAKTGQWFTPERRIVILYGCAFLGLVWQGYAITAEHFAHTAEHFAQTDARLKFLHTFCRFVHSALA